MQLNIRRRKYRQLQQKYFSRRAEIKTCKSKKAYKKKKIIENEIEKCAYIAEDVRMFVKMQVVERTAVKRWSMEQKILAQNLFYKTPSYHTFLRSMGFFLPSPTSINRWLPIKNVLPGFVNKEAICNLNTQLSSFNELQKYACKTFDEIRCRPELEYNDKHDQNEGDGTERTGIIADQISCFMVPNLHER